MNGIDEFLSLKPVASTISPEEWRNVPVAVRTQSIFISKVEKVQFIKRIKQLIGDFMENRKETVIGPNGEPVEVSKVQGKSDFVRQALEFAREEGMINDEDTGSSYHGNVVNVGSRARLELVFDTAIRKAHGIAKFKADMSPDRLKTHPGNRFVRYPGAKIKRTVHEANEDAVRLKTDFNFWANQMNSREIGGFEVPWAPFGFNSYMQTVPVRRAECERLGLINKGEEVAMPDTSEYGVDILELYGKKTSASLSNLDDELRDSLIDELTNEFEEGPRVEDERVYMPEPNRETVMDIIIRGETGRLLGMGLASLFGIRS